VTLNPLSKTRFEVTFNADGSVTSGAGSIALGSGEGFRRLSIFAAGGVAAERWNGSSWVSGS
jgi:hypothetical protein